MDQKKMEIVAKLFNKMVAYQKCIESKCKRESIAHKKATEHHKKRLDNLRQDLTKNKISFEKFKTEVAAVRTAIMDIEETKQKNECALKKCKTELLSILDTFIGAVKRECPPKKKSDTCDVLREFETIRDHIKRDKLTHEDMKVMMSKLSKL